MNKIDRYEKEVRKIARKLNDNETYSQIVIEDVTARTEKGFINKLNTKLEKEIKAKQLIEFDTTLESNMIKIFNSRMKTLNK